MRRPRVVYWNNIPSPYHVERLNAVVERGNVDLEAWFSARIENDRSWKVQESSFRFRYRYLPSPPIPALKARVGYINLPLPLFRERRPDILISLYAAPTFVAGWALAKARGARTVFRYLPTYDAWIKRTRLKEATKRRLFPLVDGFKTSGPEAIEQLASYGIDPERIHVVTQSIDVERFRSAASDWRPRRDSIRAQLGVHGTCFAFVGRLWRGKGLDYLLEAYRTASAGTAETTLLIVGDGPDELRYRQAAAQLGRGRVVFTGFVQQPDLPPLYAASDVFVFPTLGDPNGLVVEEAMVSGLPIIAFDSAGDIHQRVPEGVAGHVVATGDTAAFADRMIRLMGDPKLAASLGSNGQQIASAKTHSRYANDFEHMVEAVLARPPHTEA